MRHHFVPQFLLAGWGKAAADERFEEFRLDLPGLPSRRRVPCYQFDLYSLTRAKVAGLDRDAIETVLLKRIDNEAAKVRHKLVTKGLASLTPNERSYWVHFLTSLRVRQPEIVSKMRVDGADHLRRTLQSQPEQYEQLKGDGDPPKLESWVEDVYPGPIENFGMGIFKDVIFNDDVCQKLFRLRWWLYDFTKGKYDLLLSDNPSIWAGGIDAPDYALVLPISPRLAFLATRSETSGPTHPQPHTDFAAIRLNHASVLQTRARLYSRTSKPRDFIEKCLALKKANARFASPGGE